MTAFATIESGQVLSQVDLSDFKVGDAVVVLSEEEYQKLMNDSSFLSCLQGAGVDNWDGYDFAQEAYDEECPFPEAD